MALIMRSIFPSLPVRPVDTLFFFYYLGMAMRRFVKPDFLVQMTFLVFSRLPPQACPQEV